MAMPALCRLDDTLIVCTSVGARVAWATEAVHVGPGVVVVVVDEGGLVVVVVVLVVEVDVSGRRALDDVVGAGTVGSSPGSRSMVVPVGSMVVVDDPARV